jgi:hypothetical protein
MTDHERDIPIYRERSCFWIIPYTPFTIVDYEALYVKGFRKNSPQTPSNN